MPSLVWELRHQQSSIVSPSVVCVHAVALAVAKAGTNANNKGNKIEMQIEGTKAKNASEQSKRDKSSAAQRASSRAKNVTMEK